MVQHAHRRAFALLVLAGIGVIMFQAAPAIATALPNGFAETRVVTGLASPTTMTLSPDGRIFVAEQAGSLRVIKNGTLLPTPFMTLNVDNSGERGLLGVAFDPSFPLNQYLYVYYTVPGSPSHNRISRFTAMGDVVQPGSEVMIADLDDLSDAIIHNGGAMHFGPDGALYVSVGDNYNGANAQSLTTRKGKILRIYPDGSIPTNNPFYTTASGANRAIWALGFRNPFTFGFQPGTGRMFVNDVGQDTWEEIDDVVSGGNYGWPETEGSTNDPRFHSPIFAYLHGTTTMTGCAITGGTFYNPSTVQFPTDYVGDYFFADYCNGWIRRFDPATGLASDFASGTASPVDLAVSDSGSLYYLGRGIFGYDSGTNGSIYRIDYTGSNAPSIGTQPQSVTASTGGSATFTVAANGTPPLSYQWQRNDTDIPGATASSYTLTGATINDDGARFRVRVTNTAGSTTSNEATLTVTSNQPPSPTITAPPAGSTYAGGDTISYAGTATDPEDGSLPASAFTWKIDFHHADHIHPFMAPTTGAKSGSFVVPTVGHTDTNVWFRIYLSVRDSGGLTTTVYRDVHPRVVQLTLKTEPPGLSLNLDAQPVSTPTTTPSVVGVQRTLEAPSPKTVGTKTYVFDHWSDGASAQHTISTPSTDTTYIATYREAANASDYRQQVLGAVSSYFRLGESGGSLAADRLGGPSGTYMGSPIFGQLGAIGGDPDTAVGLRGSDYVQVPDTPANSLTGPFTVEAWVKFDTNTAQQGIAEKYDAPGLNGYALRLTSQGKLQCWSMANPASASVTGTTTLSVGVFHHVACRFDGATLQVLLDGKLDGSVATTIGPSDGAQPLRIGARGDDGAFALTGTIDEVALYRGALSTERLAAHQATTGPAYSADVLAHPVGYWRLGESSGTVAADQIANGNGTHIGSPVLGQAGAIAGDPDTATRYDGSSHTQVPDSAALSLSGPFTLEAWTKLDTNTVQQGLLEKYDAPSDKGYALRITAAGKLACWVLGSSQSASVTGSTTVSTGVFHHVACRYDGTTVKVYLDGNEDGSATAGVAPADGSQTLKLAARGDDGNYRLQGVLDEAVVYAGALAPRVLQAHAAFGGSSPPPSGTAPSIATQPGDKSVTVGASATFTVTANGTAPLSYQWQRDGSDIAGATSSSYTLGSATAGDNGALFRVRVTNSYGSVLSNAATLTVTSSSPPPSSSGYRAEILASAVAFFRLGEVGGGAAADESGGPAGSYVGSPVYGQLGAVSGDPDTAVRLTGSDYVRVPDTAADSFTGPFTIEAWAKFDSNTSQQGIVEKYDVPGLNGYAFRLTSQGKLQCWTLANPASATVTGATTVSVGVYHHVACRFDGSALQVYLDGHVDGSAATTIAPTDGSQPLKIGARGDDAATRLLGTIDEVALYKGAVSTGRLDAHGTTTGPAYRADVLSAPAGYWRLGEASGSTAADATGANNGSYVGSPTLGQAGAIGGDSDTAARFDGSNYGEIPDSPSLSPTGPFTLEAWVKLDTNTVQQAVIEKYDVPNFNGYALRLTSGGKLQCWVLGASQFSSVAGATTITTGAYHHVACRYDGSTLKVYLDGAEDGSATASVGPGDGSHPLELAARGDDRNMRLRGVLDEAVVYAGAVAPNRLRAHAQQG